MKVYLLFETFASNICSLIVEIHGRYILDKIDDSDILFYSALELYFHDSIHLDLEKGLLTNILRSVFLNVIIISLAPYPHLDFSSVSDTVFCK